MHEFATVFAMTMTGSGSTGLSSANRNRICQEGDIRGNCRAAFRLAIARLDGEQGKGSML
jgi:hypothetical protein